MVDYNLKNRYSILTDDTSFAVKGLIPPRRKKQNEIFGEQQRMFKLARSYLDYDTIFLTVTETSGSELLTDDSLQHRIALSRGIVSHFLREMI